MATEVLPFPQRTGLPQLALGGGEFIADNAHAPADDSVGQRDACGPGDGAGGGGGKGGEGGGGVRQFAICNLRFAI